MRAANESYALKMNIIVILASNLAMMSRVSTQYAHIFTIQCKYVEIFFFWNRISLDLNYSRSAGTLLTVKPETPKVKRFEIFIRLCNSNPRLIYSI